MKRQDVVRTGRGGSGRTRRLSAKSRVGGVKMKIRSAMVIDRRRHDRAIEIGAAVDLYRGVGCVHYRVHQGTARQRYAARPRIVDLNIGRDLRSILDRGVGTQR